MNLLSYILKQKQKKIFHEFIQMSCDNLIPDLHAIKFYGKHLNIHSKFRYFAVKVLIKVI